MKFGERLFTESVPNWSLHNVDYNWLKLKIKTHTTRDMPAPTSSSAAVAVAIPGSANAATARPQFEDRLYTELSLQHTRIGLFVASKADEISRRLGHIAARLDRPLNYQKGCQQVRQCQRYRRRLSRLERDTLNCAADICNLRRFIAAQAIAFRKLTKKYRKWTGSAALGSRFDHNILSDPKSFTNRDFDRLQSLTNVILDAISHAAATLPPLASNASFPSSSPAPSSSSSSHGVRNSTSLQQQPCVTHYWNEYDNGSDAPGLHSDSGSSYAILIPPPDHSSNLPTALLNTITSWICSLGSKPPGGDPDPERATLLPGCHPHSDAHASYMACLEAVSTDPSTGAYLPANETHSGSLNTTYFILTPSQSFDRVLAWGATVCCIVTFVLMAAAALLMALRLLSAVDLNR